MKHWIDNADSYICPDCGFETNNPNRYAGAKCPKCGFQDEKDKSAPINFNKILAGALHRVGHQEGIKVDENFGFVTIGAAIDDYLVTCYLARLFENGKAEIKIAPSECEYLFKLLHIKEQNK